jgi:hypothetical protein
MIQTVLLGLLVNMHETFLQRIYKCAISGPKVTETCWELAPRSGAERVMCTLPPVE